MSVDGNFGDERVIFGPDLQQILQNGQPVFLGKRKREDFEEQRQEAFSVQNIWLESIQNPYIDDGENDSTFMASQLNSDSPILRSVNEWFASLDLEENPS